MCGRVIADLTSEGWQLLGVPAPRLQPRYNATRGATLGLIRAEDQRRTVTPARWGLVPQGMTRQEADRLALFNTRVETVAQKAAFRDAWRERHGLLAVSGWIEWQPGAKRGKKQPFLVRRVDGKPVVLAALWTEHEGQPTFSVMTGPAQPGLAWLHHRQPLAVASNSWDAWLNHEQGTPTSLPERVYQVMPLDAVINDARLDHPGVVHITGEPVQAA